VPRPIGRRFAESCVGLPDARLGDKPCMPPTSDNIGSAFGRDLFSAPRCSPMKALPVHPPGCLQGGSQSGELGSVCPGAEIERRGTCIRGKVRGAVSNPRDG